MNDCPGCPVNDTHGTHGCCLGERERALVSHHRGRRAGVGAIKGVPVNSIESALRLRPIVIIGKNKSKKNRKKRE